MPHWKFISLADKIKVMQAALEGKKIQCKTHPDAIWLDVNESSDNIAFNWDKNLYRVKPREPREFYIVPDCNLRPIRVNEPGKRYPSNAILVREVLPPDEISSDS